MKTYQLIAALCLPLGVLAGLLAYGAGGSLQAEPYQKPDMAHGAAAAQSASSAAELFDLGRRYSLGAGVAQDDEEAAYYYRKAAEMGSARARISLGVLYANGRGVRKDFAEAVYWMHQAFALAQLQERDTTVVEAVAWLQKASEHGYAPAQHMLESMRDGEKLGMANSARPVLWLKKPAVVGDAKTQARPPAQFPAG